MKFLNDFTYRNLHGFARFPGDSTALVASVMKMTGYMTYIFQSDHVARCRPSGQGVGLVTQRSRVRLSAGASPGSLGQLSLPSLRNR